jgi:transcriptional regulator with XRE-family HTH domain
MSQEDFEGVATRAYVSELERGLKSPTLNMIESLAASMNVQPLTLMLATYAAKHPQASPEALMQQALEELKSLP